MNIQDLFKDTELSEEESNFLEWSRTATTADMNQSRVATDLYLIKTLKKISNDNEKLSQKVSKTINNISIAGVVISLIIGGATVWVSYNQLHESHLKDSSDIILNFDTQLNQEPYVSIADALDSEPSTKILASQTNKGFSVTQVEKYLSIFEEMGDFFQEGIIECKMINNDFSYDIQKAWGNSDVQSLVKKDQITDHTLWTNFVNLGKRFSNKEPCSQ